MVDQNEELYGRAAQHSEHKPGDQVRYHDPEGPNGIDTGEIIYVVERAGPAPVSYMVLPDSTQFPLKIRASDIIEEPSTDKETR